MAFQPVGHRRDVAPWAVRPTIRPTWPAGRRSSSTSFEPTRSVSGPTASGGTMWSFSPMTLRNGTVMSARSTVRPPSGTWPVARRFWRGEQLAGLHERGAGERDVVVGPLGHHLVGGDEVVVPQVLPEVDVAGDVADRLEHPERVAHHVSRDVAGGVEHVGSGSTRPSCIIDVIGPMCSKSTGVAMTARLRTGIGVAGDGRAATARRRSSSRTR